MAYQVESRTAGEEGELRVFAVIDTRNPDRTTRTVHLFPNPVEAALAAALLNIDAGE